MEQCDCLNFCGDDPWLAKGKVRPCDARIKQAEEEATRRSVVSVDAERLCELLVALTGADHLIREMQATRGFPNNPIDVLAEQFNAQRERVNAELAKRGK